MISKPFLIVGALAGASAIGIGGYFGVSALDSRQTTLSEETLSNNLIAQENDLNLREGDSPGTEGQGNSTVPAGSKANDNSAQTQPSGVDGGTGQELPQSGTGRSGNLQEQGTIQDNSKTSTGGEQDRNQPASGGGEVKSSSPQGEPQPVPSTEAQGQLSRAEGVAETPSQQS